MKGLGRRNDVSTSPYTYVKDTFKVPAGAALVNEGKSVVNSEIVTSPKTLTTAEFGKTLYFNSTTGISITLPGPSIGGKFQFIVKTQPTSGNHIVKTPSGGDLIYGRADVNSANVAFSAEDQVDFVVDKTLPGDKMDLETDGTNWYADAISSGAAGSITGTAT